MGSDIEHQRIHDEVRVIAEFGDVSDGTSYVEHGMAREIMRLRAILAMLRKPDLDVLARAMTAWSRTGDVPAMLHAALTIAEREVANDRR